MNFRWYKNGRLNLRHGEKHDEKLTTLAALRSREVKIYECSDRCGCKRKNCSNSITSDKTSFPMMMVSRELLLKDARKPPTVYALCKVVLAFSFHSDVSFRYHQGLFSELLTYEKSTETMRFFTYRV